MSIRIPENLALGHGGSSDGARSGGAKFAETFELYGALNSEASVLDIGCGPGRMALGIGERYGFKTSKYLGFDIQSRDIEWCSREITTQFPNFEFIHLDVFNGHYNPKGKISPTEVKFPSANAVFDFAFATSVFTHMLTAEFLVYLRETRRCLKPGGHFLATFFCIEDVSALTKRPPRFTFDTKVADHCYTATPDNPEDVIGFDKDFVIDCFEEAGFRDVRFHRGEWAGVKGGRHSQDCVVGTAD